MKICPIVAGKTRRVIAFERIPDVNKDAEVQCIEKECAWWDLDRECCGMLPYKEVRIAGGINTHQY